MQRQMVKTKEVEGEAEILAMNAATFKQSTEKGCCWKFI